MIETYLNRLTKEQFENHELEQLDSKRFVIEREPVIGHLNNMFCEHVRITNKILVGGDCILEKPDIRVMLDLIVIEKERLKKIFLDSWEYQFDSKVRLINYEEMRKKEDYDPSKYFLADITIKNSPYEIRNGRFGDYSFKVEKK